MQFIFFFLKQVQSIDLPHISHLAHCDWGCMSSAMENYVKHFHEDLSVSSAIKQKMGTKTKLVNLANANERISSFGIYPSI